MQLIQVSHGEEELQDCCERCSSSFSPAPAEHTPRSVCREAVASREADGLCFVLLDILPWLSPGRGAGVSPVAEGTKRNCLPTPGAEAELSLP